MEQPKARGLDFLHVLTLQNLEFIFPYLSEYQEIIKRASAAGIAKSASPDGQSEPPPETSDSLDVMDIDSVDWSEFVRYCEPHATEAEPDAAFSYAVCLSRGLGVEKNLDLAARSFKLAAAQGHELGLVSYGLCLIRGMGVDKDVESGMSYIEQAANKGNELAKYVYGLALHYGDGVPGDKERAKAVLRDMSPKGVEVCKWKAGGENWRLELTNESLDSESCEENPRIAKDIMKQFAEHVLKDETVEYMYREKGDVSREQLLSFKISKSIESLVFGEIAARDEKEIVGHVPASYFKHFLTELVDELFSRERAKKLLTFKSDANISDFNNEYISFYNVLVSHDMWALSKKECYQDLYKHHRAYFQGSKRTLRFLVDHWNCFRPSSSGDDERTTELRAFLMEIICRESSTVLDDHDCDNLLRTWDKDCLFDFLNLVREMLSRSEEASWQFTRWAEFILKYCVEISNKKSLQEVLEYPTEETDRFMSFIGVQHLNQRHLADGKILNYFVPVKDPALQNIGALARLVQGYIDDIDSLKSQITGYEIELRKLQARVNMKEGADQEWLEVSQNVDICEALRDSIVLSGNPHDETYGAMLETKAVCTETNENCYWSRDEISSWIECDLGERRAVIKGYAIRSAKLGVNGPHPKSWRIEGRNASAEPWVEIHSMETYELNKPNWSLSVDVSDTKGPFRYIRFTQMGANAAGSFHLCLSSISLMGNIWEHSVTK